MLAGLGARARPYLPALGVSTALAILATHAIREAAGHPAAPLDDAFIHFQYAKRIAQGAFFSYVPGGGYTTGATSAIWPLILAPFYAVGFRDLSILTIAWILGTLAHAALAVETARVATRLAGETLGVIAGAMSLVFAANAWFAWSGMETIPLAWILMRCVRLAGDLCEPDARNTRSATETARSLALAGFLAPLVRPEGIFGAAIAVVALALGRELRVTRKSALAAAPIAGALVVPLMHLAFAGHAASSTAIVKWLVLSPYYDRAALFATFEANVHLLLGDLLDGGDWSALFLPEKSAFFFVLGLPALGAVAVKRRLPILAGAVAIVGLGVLVPCTYMSLLWNRLRYIWPFSAAHFVMLACLAAVVSDVARRVRPRLALAGPVLGGVFVGALATHLSEAIKDLAQSAAAIDKQQVALGRWAKEHLPADARIGVNDTGAIAYFGERPTFDIVGLTTEGEARYWVSGPGSRFEHYEKLPREKLPTHFIVYPQWMAMPEVLGHELYEATVLDQSILGGPTMVVYEAAWDALGTGALPKKPAAGVLVDEVDVADLASEQSHRFELGAGASDTSCVVASDFGLDEVPRAISDGGRTHRTRDSFRLHFGSNRRAHLVARLGADLPLEVHVAVDGRDAGTIPVHAASFDEGSIEVEATGEDANVTVLAPAGTEFSSFHYWLYAGR